MSVPPPPVRHMSAMRHHMSATWPHMGATWRHTSAMWRHMSATWRHMSATWHHVSAMWRHMSVMSAEARIHGLEARIHGSEPRPRPRGRPRPAEGRGSLQVRKSAKKCVMLYMLTRDRRDQVKRRWIFTVPEARREEKVKKCEKSENPHLFPLLGDLRQGGRKPKSTFAFRSEKERISAIKRKSAFPDRIIGTFP